MVRAPETNARGHNAIPNLGLDAEKEEEEEEKMEGWDIRRSALYAYQELYHQYHG